MANWTTIDKRKREDRYISGKPSDDVVAHRRLFDGLNEYIMKHGGWVTSIPGRAEVVFEALPASRLPAQLIELGYNVKPADPAIGQRLLANAVSQRLSLTSSGAFEEMTEGSTKAVAEIRTHAGIVRVVRYSFTMT
jgi:hypothetical protein